MELKEFAGILSTNLVGTYSDAELKNPNFVALWFRSLGNYSPEALKTALQRDIETNRYKVSISSLKDILDGSKETREILAKDLASKIYYALGRYGYSRDREASEYVGDAGQRVVQRFGGWSALSDMCVEESKMSYYMRDIEAVATSVLLGDGMAKNGIKPLSSELPPSNANRKMIEDEIKKLTMPKEEN